MYSQLFQLMQIGIIIYAATIGISQKYSEIVLPLPPPIVMVSVLITAGAAQFGLLVPKNLVHFWVFPILL